MDVYHNWCHVVHTKKQTTAYYNKEIPEVQHVPILHEVCGGQLLSGAHWQIAFWFDGHIGSNDNKQHTSIAVQPNPGGQSIPRLHRWYAWAPFGQSGNGSKQQPRPTSKMISYVNIGWNG